MQEPNLNSSPTGMTPGPLLKTARQEKGLSIVDVAARLCLSAQYIEDIERDDYSRMSARAYARGYIMSYAHLLGVPEDQILTALTQVQMNFAPSKNTASLDHEKSNMVYQPMEPSRQRSSVMVWISIFVLIILIGLVVLWWRGPSNVPGRQDNNATSVPLQQQPTTPSPPTTPSSPGSGPVSIPIPSPSPLPKPGPPTTPTPRAPAHEPPAAVNDSDIAQPSELKKTKAELPAPRASTQ